MGKRLKTNDNTSIEGCSEAPADLPIVVDGQIAPAHIRRLTIQGFRGIRDLLWRPANGVNVILGGGDVGKTTILDAIGLLLNPTNSTVLAESDYYGRALDSGFSIEAVITLPPEAGANTQTKQAWPWYWNGSEPVVPQADGEAEPHGEEVYRLRVRGTPDLELLYEVLQPDNETEHLSVTLRRGIGLVRLSGDDRNDRDLRLVQGSALDRLLSDKGLRSRMGSELTKSKVRDQLKPESHDALAALDATFRNEGLPGGIDLAITGGQGWSVAAMIGLTGQRDGIDPPLPLTSWGAGTRRLAALAIARHHQGDAPIVLVDEVERGLEPYRQRLLFEKLQTCRSQVFLTTHSTSALAAASRATVWYVDHQCNISRLESEKIDRHRRSDPETFLSRLAIIAEGKTERGFVRALLERALGAPLEQHGIHVSDGGGQEKSLDLLEQVTRAGLVFGGFADNEAKHPARWQSLETTLGPLLFRWRTGCTEQNILRAIPDDELEAFLTDNETAKTGMRLRTLADRLRGQEDKNFKSIRRASGSGFRNLVLAAASGKVPQDLATATRSEKRKFEVHGQTWFKTDQGGRELERKMFELGAWPTLRLVLLPFCNAVRKAVDLPEITDLS